MKMKIDIGLDIGIASVGWVITDARNNNIILHGNRLFNTVDDPKDGKLLNETRREQRSQRRQSNRRKTLKRDFIKLLLDKKIISNISFDKKGHFVNKFRDLYINDPIFRKTIDNKDNDGLGIFYLRKKAMNEKVNLKELINVLYWYINHRGFKYEVAGDEETSKVFKQHDKYMKLKMNPIDKQIKYYKENKTLNGTFNRTIKTSDYINEIDEIFKNNIVDKEFKEQFLKLFKRQRSFEEGPGKNPSSFKDKTNISPWGRWEMVNGELVEHKTIWETTVGKCPIYKEENRAPAKSATSELFNLLNDLNNISINKEKLSKEMKISLIKLCLKGNATTSKIKKGILKEFDLSDDNDIKGCRVDKSNEQIFTPMSSIYKINQILKIDDVYNEIFINETINEKNIFNEISNILNSTTILENRIKELNKINSINEEQATNLSKITGFSATHSFSYKAMNEMINIMIVENKNQMNIITEQNLNTSKFELKPSRFISKEWIENIIDTPTVKRSLRQTINVLNEIFKISEKKDYEIRDIVIEMARENNNKEVKNKIKNNQKYFEQFNAVIDSKMSKGYGGKVKLKLWLLDQQNGKDAYSGKPIDSNEVINNHGKFDIDHIIPRSQSFDNSRNNKVLTLQQTNAKKSNQTPYQYLDSNEFDKMDKLWKEWYLPNKNDPADKKMWKSREKYEYISSKIDFSNPNNQLGFIQRNLVDTRYTTRMVLQALKEFAKVNDKNFKVKTINGKMTSFARRMMEQSRNHTLNRPEDVEQEVFDPKTRKKNRIWNGHHAEDAYIITVINSNYRESKALEKVISNPNFRYVKFDDKPNNDVDRNIAKVNTNFDTLISSFDLAREELNNKMNDMRFSRMVIKKTNGKLFNDTLYEGKKLENGDIQKITHRDLYELDKKQCKEYFGSEEKHKNLLMDDKLFKGLREIFLLNSEETNPFLVASKGKEHIEIIEEKNIRLVRKIRTQDGIKKTHEIIFSNKNGNSFNDTMAWFSIHVYKDSKNKFKLIPINATNSKVSKNGIDIIKEKIQDQKHLRGIEKDAPIISILYRNNILVDPEGKQHFIVGHSYKQDKLELKPIWKQNSKQNHFTINTKIKDWKLLESNILGEIFNIKKLF